MIKTLKRAVMAAAPISMLSAMPAFAETKMLPADDYVGISFWLISMALIAATAFFWLEIGRVSAKWRTSLVVSGMVTMIAAVHYFYMRDVWVEFQSTPTVYRYIDWLITVPLLMIEFYLILTAITKVSSGIFWRLMIGTLVMLIGGYIGETSFTDPNARIFGEATITIGFIIGMLGWAYILYEIFAGEAGQLSAEKAPASVQSAFSTMRWIVTIGWAIYPLGYLFGYMLSETPDFNSLNIIYNLADVLNKIAFGVIIWSVATSESQNA